MIWVEINNAQLDLQFNPLKSGPFDLSPVYLSHISSKVPMAILCGNIPRVHRKPFTKVVWDFNGTIYTQIHI